MPISYLARCGLLHLGLVLLVSPGGACPRVRLIGAGEQRGVDTFRCVSLVTAKIGPIFTDRTGDGLKVGQLHARPENLTPTGQRGRYRGSRDDAALNNPL